MNMSQNCMNYIHFTQESVVGTYQWKGDIDLANIVLIGLTEDLPEKKRNMNFIVCWEHYYLLNWM